MKDLLSLRSALENGIQRVRLTRQQEKRTGLIPGKYQIVSQVIHRKIPLNNVDGVTAEYDVVEIKIDSEIYKVLADVPIFRCLRD